MAKRAKKRVRGGPPPAENRAAEVTTIGWMLSTLTAAACELVWIAARGYAAWRFGGDMPENYALFLRVLLFATVVVALLTLALIPVVYRLRRVPPPWPILVFSLVVAMVPLAMALTL